MAVLVLPVLLISIDMSVLGIAVPAISADLRPSSAQLLWIIDIYSFLLAGLLVLMGSLGDRIGRRLLLLLGTPAFALASLIAAFSTSADMMIAARALLGIGGATLMPSTLGLVRSIFPDRTERRIALAVWSAAFSGGAALGPVVGGFLLEHFWWGSVFLINVPVMILFLIGAALLLPESKDPQPGPFDPTSAFLSIAGILPVVYAFKTLAKGFEPTALLALALGVVLLALFIRRQRMLAHPMIDLSLFSRPGFSAALLVNVLSIFALLGMMFFLPQYLMLVKEVSPMAAGLWMLPLAAATIVGAFGSAALARRMSVRAVITSGVALLVAGLLVATAIDPADTLVLFVIATVLFGMGTGLAETLTNDVILAAAPPERAGAASAISETGYEFGGAMGTAVLGTVGMTVYASALGPLPELDERTAEAARQTLAGADQIADGLAPAAGRALHEASSAAFVQGLDVVAAICAGLMVIAAIIAWRGFRSISTTEDAASLSAEPMPAEGSGLTAPAAEDMSGIPAEGSAAGPAHAVPHTRTSEQPS